MKAFTVFLAVAAFAGIPLLAQQANVDVSASGQSTTTNPATANTQAASGFGDEGAARWHEMTSATCELQGRLESKSAKVGDRVALKTTAKMQISDGTAIPKGSRLIGHITEVQASGHDHAIAQVGIAFDHIELKNGGSVPVHTLIRTIRPPVSLPSLNAMDDGGMMNAGGMGAPGGAMGGDSSASATAPGGRAVSEAAGGAITRSGEVAPSASNPKIPPALGPGSRGDASAQNSGGASAAATPRSGPRPTGIPSILLAGSSTASGLLINASHREIEFDDGTQFEMGLVADK